ncbi:MAG TPA: DNA alkylation repair protein [Phycisphaerales bacterium]|nr:DNA alkylation repair protein [Phycisphaerales bacterium]
MTHKIDPYRTGASSPKDVPKHVLRALNRGEIETVNLGEWLAVDTAELLQNVAPELGKEGVRLLTDNPDMGLMDRWRTASRLLLDHFGDGAIDRFADHPSDTVRGWVCAIIGMTDSKGWTLKKRLARIRPFADDPHFGVRENAWLGVRGRIIDDVDRAVALLTPWTNAGSANIRRFASEATRPRGVWCAHIPALKTDPAKAMPLLEPLRADPAKYVQDSVGNWLNDAGKTEPEFVIELTERWLEESPGTETARIVRRARRNL